MSAFDNIQAFADDVFYTALEIWAVVPLLTKYLAFATFGALFMAMYGVLLAMPLILLDVQSDTNVSRSIRGLAAPGIAFCWLVALRYFRGGDVSVFVAEYSSETRGAAIARRVKVAGFVFVLTGLAKYVYQWLARFDSVA